MPYKGTRKITEPVFKELKLEISINGVEKTAGATGFAVGTLKLIEQSENHADFRAKRKAKSAKLDAKRSKAKSNAVEKPSVTPAPQPAKVEKPSAPAIKPLTPLTGVQHKAAPRPPRPDDFVKRVEVDRALAAQQKQVLSKIDRLVKKVEEYREEKAALEAAQRQIKRELDELVHADTALRVEQLEQPRKPFWKRWF